MNYTEFKDLAVALINNHAGFLPGQESDRILHTQFALAEAYSQGYYKSTADREGIKND